MKIFTALAVMIAALGLTVHGANAQITPVEPGHSLSPIVDSVFPRDPSQTLLETTAPVGDIESIGVNPGTGDLYIQLQYPPGAPTSQTTHIFKVSPAGIVTFVAVNTGFGINARGTDLHFNPASGLLLTQDQNGPPRRIVGVPAGGGAPVTYVTVPFFIGNTFGMDLSAGAGGSDVPAGEVLFTADIGGNGMHSAPFGGPLITHLPAPTVAGDDLVIQPDGDWIHAGDFSGRFTAYRPAGPEPHLTTASSFSIQGIFTSAGLPFVNGSRATVCDSTGDLYVSYSGGQGGSGIFRVNEPLTTATLLLTIGQGLGGEGLHDLIVGPSTSLGNSLYFSVHDTVTGGEQVWEATIPECPGGKILVDIKPGSDPNSINTKSNGVVPVAALGSAAFDVTTIDLTTLAFGPGGAAPAHDLTNLSVYFDHLQDVNGDGYMDLVSHYPQTATLIAAGDIQACLKADLIGGGSVFGCDAVRVVK